MSVFEQGADGKMCQVTMATAFEKANLHVQIAASLQYIISLRYTVCWPNWTLGLTPKSPNQAIGPVRSRDRSAVGWPNSNPNFYLQTLFTCSNGSYDLGCISACEMM